MLSMIVIKVVIDHTGYEIVLGFSWCRLPYKFSYTGTESGRIQTGIQNAEYVIAILRINADDTFNCSRFFAYRIAKCVIVNNSIVIADIKDITTWRRRATG